MARKAKAKEAEAIAAKLERLPERGEIDINIQEQLIVEFYSR